MKQSGKISGASPCSSKLPFLTCCFYSIFSVSVILYCIFNVIKTICYHLMLNHSRIYDKRGPLRGRGHGPPGGTTLRIHP